MHKLHANVVFSNESVLLKNLVPIWNTYPVDEWVFYNDRSTDDSVDIVNQLDAKVTVINDNLDGPFDETYSRDRMLEYSRGENAKFVFALDADEFISSNMLEGDNLNYILKQYETHDIYPYWYNFVDDVNHIRQDPLYVNNYKGFIIHVPTAGSFKQYNHVNIHCARTPPNNLPKAGTKDWGLMHLQAMNVKFYAIKQLWYKHWEYKDLGGEVDQLNQKYDPVVNNLQFNKTKIDESLVAGVDIKADIFDELLEIKQYREYIQENYVEGLITFGKEYL